MTNETSTGWNYSTDYDNSRLAVNIHQPRSLEEKCHSGLEARCNVAQEEMGARAPNLRHPRRRDPCGLWLRSRINRSAA
jgi:hypothetical protein